MDKGDFENPSMLVGWKAGRGKHRDTDARNTSPRNAPVLPIEIIDKILREACEWPLGRAERQLLTASTLVCKSWLPLARRLLYYSLAVEIGSFYTPRDPGKFVPEELLQQSHLLKFTRSLSIHAFDKCATTMPLFSEGDGPEGSRECVRIPDFLFLLAHTSRLRYLELSLHWTEETLGPIEHHLLDWLSSLVLPVEALNLKDRGKWDAQSSFACDLVGIWPTIRALRLVTGYKGLLPERPSMGLRELRLPNTFSATLIEWLLPPPPPNEQSNLLFLELHRIPVEALPVLSIHGPSVSSLTLTYKPSFEIAHLFTKLEELIIKGISWGSPLPAFPRTLKHIRLQLSGFPFMSSPFVAEIARVVTTLPDLCVLSIVEVLTTHKYFPELQAACEIHKVDILTDGKGKMRAFPVIRVGNEREERDNRPFTSLSHTHPTIDDSNLSVTSKRQSSRHPLSCGDGSLSSTVHVLRVL